MKALNTGLLPPHYLSSQSKKSLQAYIENYLTQEIKEESLVRSLPSFSRQVMVAELFLTSLF
ncbi:MAG: hypothetical protein KBD83_02505 [Gammaproteobacteria bacterium]|nr:hypothetical protein [Gammaproteobacteria bacterium]